MSSDQTQGTGIRTAAAAPELHTLLGGLAIGESPRWHEGRLWFSNWGAREVIAVDLNGTSQVMARVPTDIPFSIDWLPDGELAVVAGREGLLLRQLADGSLVTYADLTSVSAHPWNEIVVDGRGNTYLNNIGFDLMSGAAPAPGIVAVVAPDGSIREVADGVQFPNGMAVTPDNSTLILAESYASKLTAFDIGSDGSLSNRRVWADLAGGVPDGICLDADGAVWYADVPNKRCVRVREGGEVLQSIVLELGCFACMLGGESGHTLFMMAAEWGGPDKMAGDTRAGRVMITHAPSPGIGWPGPNAAHS